MTPYLYEHYLVPKTFNDSYLLISNSGYCLQSTGHFEHPTKCNHFIICDNGREHDFHCATPSTFYNVTLNLCDHAENVDCSSRGE